MPTTPISTLPKQIKNAKGDKDSTEKEMAHLPDLATDTRDRVLVLLLRIDNVRNAPQTRSQARWRAFLVPRVLGCGPVEEGRHARSQGDGEGSSPDF